MIGRAEKNGPQGDGVNKDLCFTLNTADRHAVAYDCRNHCDSDISATLQAKNNGGQSLNYINPVFETYQNTTGTLMANSHPGSYSGQDAYQDMFIASAISRAPVDPRRVRFAARFSKRLVHGAWHPPLRGGYRMVAGCI